jgi:cellulose synthase/poly-beta-1,6-N-acetylglucosamine synthase-like glycosyltransferase
MGFDNNLSITISILLLCCSCFVTLIIKIIQYHHYSRVVREIKSSAHKTPEFPYLPKVSILTAAWNEEQFIRKHIENVLSLQYPDKEYILCAGGEDNTREIASKYIGKGVRLIEQIPGEGKQKALRKCFAEASGEIIFLIDADCVISNDDFLLILAPIIVQGESAATALSPSPLSYQISNPFVIYQYSLNFLNRLRSPQYIGGLSGASCAVRRDVLQAINGFGISAPTGTDYTLARQLVTNQHKIRAVPESSFQTVYHEKFGDYIRQKSRWLRNLFLIGIETQDWHHTFLSALTFITGFVGFTLPIFAIFWGELFLALWGGLYFYALSNRLMSLRLLTDYGQLNSLATIAFAPFCIIIDWFVMVRSAIETFSPAIRTRW